MDNREAFLQKVLVFGGIGDLRNARTPVYKNNDGIAYIPAP